MGDVLPSLRVAAIQAAPVFLDREATTEKASRLIREAGAGGARLVGFPEGFIPGHPLWYHFLSASSGRSRQLATQLFLNSVEVPSPTTDRLCQAAREAGVYAVIGFCERMPGTTGTMYNSQLFVSPHGEIIGKRQKIMPTGGERLVHALGSGDGLRPVETEFGPVSGLICGENSNPLAVFTLQALGTRVHVASWPSHFSETQPMLDAIEISTRALAYQGGVFVVNSVGLVSDEMIEMLASSEEDRRFLKRRQEENGGASIIGPRGRFIAGPMGPGEGILYGDINLNEIVTRKVIQDFAGHYNRPDLFTLTLNSSSPSLFRTTESSSQILQEKGTNKPNSPEEPVLVSAKLQGRSGNH
ncbi:MAG: carbon-nitrogen hydrolase family protein [Deltaproteobacteria bacterium]|nr:carbon-nitrogen hydrolase family protein [Deltaproteobacteria bacterium]